VIGAFLLLAVLFLGFYFLSTKSQPPQDSSVTQSISDSSAPGESAAATNKEHRAGAGGSQDIQNRSSLKQKK
jgi:hypothetical protein